MSLHIEMFETAPGQFTVILGDLFADRLGRDEALAVVAGALFCGTAAPPFVRTYECWSAWQERYCDRKPFRPAALLSWNRAIANH